MGWKGTLRSVRAAYRAAERDARRRQRELERRQKEYERMQELERAAYEVERHENYIQVLLSVHSECGPPVDWEAMVSVEAPQEPERVSEAEDEALRKESQYKAGFLDRLLKREQARRASLETEVERARQIDAASYRESLAHWQEELRDWKESKVLAERVLALEPKALLNAIGKVDPFSDISELGSSVRFEIGESRLLEATISVHSDSVIPKEAKVLLRSGRLSVRQMPKSRFNELFQDYVCGCVLRVANELFAVLPVEAVIVTATDSLLNSTTGHLEDAPIVSVLVPKATMARLNLQHVDPSDSMSNFVHRMSFRKTKGFEAIERLKPEEHAAHGAGEGSQERQG